MILQKAGFLLKIMNKIGYFMPMPVQLVTTKSESFTWYDKLCALGRKTYAKFFLTYMMILVWSDYVYRGNSAIQY